MADKAAGVDSPEKSSDNEESPEKAKLDTLVSELSRNYSKYLKVDITSEKIGLEDEIEDILTRLDEFTSLVDMVRGDNVLCLSNTLPEIYKKCEEMERIFEKVDQLEKMMQVVKQNLDVMEEKVTEAEEHLDSSSVKKLFNSLQKPLFSKKTGEPKKQPKYEPPEIFRTEDFFKHSQNTSSIKNETQEA